MPDAGGKRRHVAIIRELDIPVPFDLGEFTARLERQGNRPIRLCPFMSGPGAPCGAWIASAVADLCLLRARDDRLHTNLIVLHEITHMLLGHRGLPACSTLPAR